MKKEINFEVGDRVKIPLPVINENDQPYQYGVIGSYYFKILYCLV